MDTFLLRSRSRLSSYAVAKVSDSVVKGQHILRGQSKANPPPPQPPMDDDDYIPSASDEEDNDVPMENATPPANLWSLGQAIALFDALVERLYPEGVDTNKEYSELNQKDLKNYINAVLSGRDDEDEPMTINIKDCTQCSESLCTVTYDLDSAIAISTDFAWLGAYDIFSLPGKIEPLGSLKIKAPFQVSVICCDTDCMCQRCSQNESGTVQVDLGRDPCMRWARSGLNGRQGVYIMLPNKRPEHDLSEIRRQIYAAQYRAAKKVLPNALGSWCPTLDAEINRARGFRARGRASDGMKSIPAEKGTEFANHVARTLRRFAWGKNMYFLLQLRGFKDLSRSPEPLTRYDITMALSDIDWRRARIWVDMAAELHTPYEFAPLILRAQHSSFMQQAFDLTPEDVSDGEIDPWAATAEAAGGRWNFSDNPRSLHQITSAQVYTTDKNLIYNASFDDRVAKLKPKHAVCMSNQNSKLVVVDQMLVNVVDALTESMPIVARAEVRVPLNKADNVMKGPATMRRLLRRLVAVQWTNEVWYVAD